uniref:WH2 domain-containing protein n=1 Tax=Globodera pallida TaxID=36090 RepID=A0A183BTH7_GLOPA
MDGNIQQFMFDVKRRLNLLYYETIASIARRWNHIFTVFRGISYDESEHQQQSSDSYPKQHKCSTFVDLKRVVLGKEDIEPDIRMRSQLYPLPEKRQTTSSLSAQQQTKSEFTICSRPLQPKARQPCREISNDSDSDSAISASMSTFKTDNEEKLIELLTKNNQMLQQLLTKQRDNAPNPPIPSPTLKAPNRLIPSPAKKAPNPPIPPPPPPPSFILKPSAHYDQSINNESDKENSSVKRISPNPKGQKKFTNVFEQIRNGDFKLKKVASSPVSSPSSKKKKKLTEGDLIMAALKSGIEKRRKVLKSDSDLDESKLDDLDVCWSDEEEREKLKGDTNAANGGEVFADAEI